MRVAYLTFCTFALVAFSFTAGGMARADDTDSAFGGELRLQIGVGGDKVASVTYTDGSTSDLRLGTFGFLGIGGIYSPWRSESHGLDIELLVGYGTWSTGPENTEDRVSLARVPVELLAFYRYQLSDADGEEMFLRLGAGGSYHFVDAISGSGRLDELEVDIDNALGLVAEAAFVYTVFAAGVRYTLMSYEVSDNGESLDAGSLGFFLSLILEPGLL